MAIMTYPEVLQVARQLPPEAQLELAETLLNNFRTWIALNLHPPENANDSEMTDEGILFRYRDETNL